MELIQFLSEHLQIRSISDVLDDPQDSLSRFYSVVLAFNGILDGKRYHFECRYSEDKKILDLDLVDYIPFAKEGIEKLAHENYCIVYLCDFEDDERDKLERQLNNSASIISHVTQEIRHLYLFKNLWSKSWPADLQLNKQCKPVEYEHLQPEQRFIMGHRSHGRFKKSTTEMPIISIIMPTFNSEKMIEQSIQSVVYQNYPNYELLIVDGLSKDRTLEIVRKYEKYVDGVISEKDINIFDAINKGTRLSRGEYSVFLGSDDLFMPYSLEEVVKAIRAGNTPDYFYGDGLRLKDDNKIFYTKTFIRYPKYKEYHIMHIALYITREVFEEFNGFDINYHMNADSDFKLKLITRKKVGMKIDAPLGVFRDGGYSSYAKGKIPAVYKVYRKYKGLNYRFFLLIIKYLMMRITIKIIGKKHYFKIVETIKNR